MKAELLGAGKAVDNYYLKRNGWSSHLGMQKRLKININYSVKVFELCADILTVKIIV